MKLTACVTLAFLMIGCGSKTNGDADKTKTKATVTEATVTEAATTHESDEANAKAAKPADPPAPRAIGIAECDSYVAKMRACLDAGKLTPQRSDAVRIGLEQAIKQWHSLPPAARSKLASACTAALAGAQKTYGPMGCQF